jgi:hypothetical protein
MGKLHEILAVEKTVEEASNKIISETNAKFGKVDAYFAGGIKTLELLEEGLANKAIEAAAEQKAELVTTVHETLDYALNYWANAEDVKFQKDSTNQRAIADIVVDGEVLAKDVPVDTLLGLEARLVTLRNTFSLMPTLNAAVEWVPADVGGLRGAVRAKDPMVQTKTEKTVGAVVLYDATDKHPAQLEKVTNDKVVGTFTTVRFSGAASTMQKAEVIARTDKLLVAVKQARMRANSVEANDGKLGADIKNFLLAPFSTTH